MQYQLYTSPWVSALGTHRVAEPAGGKNNMVYLKMAGRKSAYGKMAGRNSGTIHTKWREERMHTIKPKPKRRRKKEKKKSRRATRQQTKHNIIVPIGTAIDISTLSAFQLGVAFVGIGFGHRRRGLSSTLGLALVSFN